MGLRCHTGAATQDHLVDHEFSIVLANGTTCGLESGIWRIGALRPFPDIAEYLAHMALPAICCRAQKTALAEIAVAMCDGLRCTFPLGFAWKALSCPAGESVGFVKADM